MSRLRLPLDGQCRCGSVRIRVSAAPILTMACHCRGCQRMSSSAYSLSAAIPAGGFEVTDGRTVRGGTREGPVDHQFCPDCMSWMFTRMEGLEFFTNVRVTMLEDTSWFSPFVETYTSKRLPFAETGAPHSYPEFPPNERFMELSAQYAAEHAED